MISEDAKSLGLYDYLQKLEAEFDKAKKDLTLYPLVVFEALAGEIRTIKKTIQRWEDLEHLK